MCYKFYCYINVCYNKFNKNIKNKNSLSEIGQIYIEEVKKYLYKE